MNALRPRDPRIRLAAAPPERIADGVEVLRGGLTRSMNVYLIEDPQSAGVVVFDAGEASMARAILAAGRRRGGISRVVLGHGDTDHRGSAPGLRAAGIPIACHADARPHAEGTGGRDYWRPELLPLPIRALHGFAHRIWDGGAVRVDGTVAGGDSVAGFEVIELPGHAPGLIGLWRERDRVALVSDAFYMTDMLGRPIEPVVPPDAYNQDSEQARSSLCRLADLDPLVAAPGHRGPLTGPGVRDALLRAAAYDAREASGRH
jgi:hydroxyacylglutathione hydrolase